MGARQRMENALLPLGIYSSDCKILEGEIAAYAAATDLVADRCDGIRREMFAVTAENEGLTRMERILGLEEADLTVQERRERILFLCSMVPGEPDTDLFLERLIELLDGKYTVMSDPAHYSVILSRTGNFAMEDLTEAADFAVKYGPAFTRFVTDMPMYTWAQIEALGMTFYDIREKGIPWGFFDETL